MADPGGLNFEFRLGHITFVKVDHEIIATVIPVSILYKSIAGRYRPVRVADGPITARYRFRKNASWDSPFPLIQESIIGESMCTSTV